MKYESKFRSDKFKVAAAKVTPHYTFKIMLFSFSKKFYLHTGAGGNERISAGVNLWLQSSTAIGKLKLFLLSNVKPEKEDMWLTTSLFFFFLFYMYHTDPIALACLFLLTTIPSPSVVQLSHSDSFGPRSVLQGYSENKIWQLKSTH